MRHSDLKIHVQKRLHRLMRRVCKLNLYVYCSGHLELSKVIIELDNLIVDMDDLIKFIKTHNQDCN